MMVNGDLFDMTPLIPLIPTFCITMIMAVWLGGGDDNDLSSA